MILIQRPDNDDDDVDDRERSKRVQSKKKNKYKRNFTARRADTKNTHHTEGEGKSEQDTHAG